MPTTHRTGGARYEDAAVGPRRGPPRIHAATPDSTAFRNVVSLLYEQCRVLHALSNGVLTAACRRRDTARRRTQCGVGWLSSLSPRVLREGRSGVGPIPRPTRGRHFMGCPFPVSDTPRRAAFSAPFFCNANKPITNQGKAKKQKPQATTETCCAAKTSRLASR